MRLIYRPIDEWPGKLRSDSERIGAPFSAKWSTTLELLDREVDMIANGGRRSADAVLQLAVPEHAIRQDGGLRSGRKPPEHPGVVLTFDGPDGPLRFSCDRFRPNYYRETVDGWHHNARAIALGLEALRKVDRYGLGTGAEQYRGFQALPPATPMGAAMTEDAAARLLAETAADAFGDSWCIADDLLSAPDRADLIRGAYRDAVRIAHPDAGGEPALFRRLTEARDLLLAGV